MGLVPASTSAPLESLRNLALIFLFARSLPPDEVELFLKSLGLPRLPEGIGFRQITMFTCHRTRVPSHEEDSVIYRIRTRLRTSRHLVAMRRLGTNGSMGIGEIDPLSLKKDKWKICHEERRSRWFVSKQCQRSFTSSLKLSH